jgi:hypothetical protein
MKALTGLTALVVVMIGVVMLTRTPGVTRMVATAELTEDPYDGGPPFVHCDPNEWR